MSVNSKMTAIADEVRTLSGSTDKLSLDTMATKLDDANTEVSTQADLMAQISEALEGKGIPGGGTSEDLDEVLTTQEALIDELKTALENKASGGAKEEQEKTIDITENGTTEVTPDDGKVLSKVTVNVDVEQGITPTGTLEITENGEYDVTEYASANVNVESDGDTLRARLTNTLTEYTIMDAFTLTMHAFRECTNLVKFSAPNLIETANNYCFYRCSSLEYVDLGKIPLFNTNDINGLHKIQTMIFRKSDGVVELTVAFANNNSITKEDYTVKDTHYYCYFYVPKALLEDYKVATNWSNYAHRFRAIEDYPEITGGII